MRTSRFVALAALGGLPILGFACASRDAKVSAPPPPLEATESRMIASPPPSAAASSSAPATATATAVSTPTPTPTPTPTSTATPTFAAPPPAAPPPAKAADLDDSPAPLEALAGISAGGRGGGVAHVPAARAEDLLRASKSASSYGGSAAYASPSIAAGEWDDNANYREFQKWLATEASLPFRPVDVAHRRFLVVRDEEGRAVPGCTIDVGDASQHTVSLLTGPSGRAILFPSAEGLGEGLVTATATCDGGNVTRPVSLTASDGVVDLRLPVSRRLPADRTIDVAFILDTTGSMSEEIASVKSTIAKVAAGLGETDVKVRIGLVEYKDRGDAFVTRVHPFATDVKGFAASVSGISAGGGGDTPESVNEGIHVALTKLDWQRGSLGRFAFLVGDAPPHLDYSQDFSYAADMKTAAHRGIQIFTVAASGMDALGQVVWRQIAQYTNAANMFVLRGGAGPQSVGGGDPLSSCGGTQKNYSSGNLDALILEKIHGELAALDADPMRIAGLGEDEKTKPCDQRIVMNGR